MSDKPKVTICPSGEALGARDLQHWASRRSAGRSGVPSSRKERKAAAKRERPKLDAADRWLAKHDAGRAAENVPPRRKTFSSARLVLKRNASAE
jgi:hypothetical protein